MSGALAGFKKAFRIGGSAPDVGKVTTLLNTRAAELKKWIDLYGELQPAGRDDALAEHATFEVGVRQALAELRSNPVKGDERIRNTLIPSIIKATDHYRVKIKQTPAKVTTAGAQQVEVFWSDLPGFDSLDRQQRNAVLAAAAQKTADGLALYQQICDPQRQGTLPGATPKDVTDLAWAMKSKAQGKSGPYIKGSLTVPNGTKLREYLDSCSTEVYRRDSSHMLEQQGKGKGQKAHERPGPGQTPRGMDFYDGAAGLGGNPPDLGRMLPAGMNALLFQEITSPNGQKSLYLKMETEGAYISGRKNKKIDQTAQTLQTRPLRRSDIVNSLKHFGNLLRSQMGAAQHGEDEDLVVTREKTPEAIKAVCKRIVAATTDKDAKATLRAAYGTELKWLSLKKYRYPRINTFLSALAALEIGEKLNPEVNDLIDELFELLDEEFGNMTSSEEDTRMGGEVVLQANDMA